MLKIDCRISVLTSVTLTGGALRGKTGDICQQHDQLWSLRSRNRSTRSHKGIGLPQIIIRDNSLMGLLILLTESRLVRFGIEELAHFLALKVKTQHTNHLIACRRRYIKNYKVQPSALIAFSWNGISWLSSLELANSSSIVTMASGRRYEVNSECQLLRDTYLSYLFMCIFAQWMFIYTQNKSWCLGLSILVQLVKLHT